MSDRSDRSGALGGARVPESPRRRKAIAAMGAGALAVLTGACAGPPQLPPRQVDASRAPKVGSTWTYAYRSGWKNVAPRSLAYTVTGVDGKGVQDRLAAPDAPAAGAERLFTSAWEIVARPYTDIMVHEFSPYLLAFGDLAVGARASVTVPPPGWGTDWTTTARVAGAERVQVAAGTFDAIRVEILGTRLYLRGQMDDAADPVRLYATAWFAPAVRRTARFTYETQAARLNPLARDHFELQSFRLA